MTFSTVFKQSSAGAVGTSRGISFSFTAAGAAKSSSSANSMMTRATTTGSIGFTVVPSSQPNQPSHAVPVLPAAPPSPAASTSKGKKATGGGRSRKVVVGGTVFPAAPPTTEVPVAKPQAPPAVPPSQEPLLVPLDWADEATRDQFGCGGSHGSGSEQLLVPTPVSCSSSLGACTDSSNFSGSSSGSSSTEPCPSFFGDNDVGGFGGAPEGFGLEEDTELMAFLQSSPLGPDDLPLSPPPRVKAVGPQARRSISSASGSTTTATTVSSSTTSSALGPCPLPPAEEALAPATQEKPPAAARPKRAVAARTRSFTTSTTTSNGNSNSSRRGKTKAKEAATKPTPAIAAAAALPPLPSSIPRSFVSSPFQVGMRSCSTSACILSFRHQTD